MDTHGHGHIDRDNAYTSSYSQPDSSLLNKSPNRLDYSSTGHHDYTTKDYTQTHHLDNIYSSQKTNDTFGATNTYHNIGTSNLAGTHSPTRLSGVHRPADLTTSSHYQNYTSTYQPLSHHHEERSLKSSRDDIKASLDSARKVRESALRLLSEGPSATKESHVLQHTYGTGTTSYGTGIDTHGVTSTVHHHHDYHSLPHVEETKLNYDVHGLDKDSGLKKSNYVHDSTFEKLSPEAKRILGSSVLDNHNSSSHLSPERKHMMHHEASPNPYLSTLANTAQTTADPIRHRDTHDVSPAPFNRDLLENINDYRMNDPVVSRRTVYTIENPALATKPTATQDNRGLHTPERVQRVRSPGRSPLDDLRHSLNNNSAKISKIIIETVDDGNEGEGLFQATQDTLGNNRLDIIMEQNVPLGSSLYRSPTKDRSARRANEQESTFREPSTLKADFDHLKRDITALTGHGHNEPHHRLGESSDAVRYQTRSDRSETEHHHHHAFEKPSSSHKSPERRSEPLVHESHHHHDDHHHHHHHHHDHKEEEETKHESHVHKEEVKVHKEKKPRHLLVKGVIGLLVIILSSLLYMELFTDIKYENYLTF